MCLLYKTRAYCQCASMYNVHVYAHSPIFFTHKRLLLSGDYLKGRSRARPGRRVAIQSTLDCKFNVPTNFMLLLLLRKHSGSFLFTRVLGKKRIYVLNSSIVSNTVPLHLNMKSGRAAQKWLQTVACECNRDSRGPGTCESFPFNLHTKRTLRSCLKMWGNKTTCTFVGQSK